MLTLAFARDLEWWGWCIIIGVFQSLVGSDLRHNSIIAVMRLICKNLYTHINNVYVPNLLVCVAKPAGTEYTAHLFVCRERQDCKLKSTNPQ